MGKKDITPINEKGERHGYWELYYSNGNIWIKRDYVNGIAHGLFEEYYHNGNLWYTGVFVNGERQGLWLLYEPYSGEIIEQTFYT